MSFSYFLELRKHNLNERKRQMALWLDKRLGFAAKMVLEISKLIFLYRYLHRVSDGFLGPAVRVSSE